MIRFAWLQARTQTAVAVAGLIAAAVALLITGPDLVHLYNTIMSPCLTRGDCSQSTVAAFLQNDRELRNALDILVIVIPGIIGAFWGAPLVAREIEAGTYRLAWTQSVTRTRWLAVKMGVFLVISMAVAGLLSLMSTWWNSPFDRVQMNAFTTFEWRDIVPMGYAAFAFALGVTAGLLIRRTLPAMATVVVAFTAVRVAVNHWVRPNLFAPMHLVVALDPKTTGFGRTNSGPDTLFPGNPDMPNAWIISTRVVDKNGRGLTSEFLASACPNLGTAAPPPSPGNTRTQVPIDVENVFKDCVTKVGATYHNVVTYQPASRYWALQWYELGIYLGAALVLSGICLWAVRRRRS